MSVVVSVEDVGPCRKELRVEVPADAVAAETSRVVKDLARQVSIPGFRKGKIPPSLLRQRYGEEIDREVVERLLPRYWDKAREESGLEPLIAPQVKEVGEVGQNEPLTFTAVVEIRPEIDLGELPELDLPEMEVEPTDEELERALDDLRRGVADWRPVEREAARGDRVALTITEVTAPEGETAGEEREPQEVEIEVGDERVWEELSLAVTGLTAGQRGTFRRREPAPPDAPDTPERERRFEVEVREVKEQELPELTDELARKLGDFESAEQLRDRARQHLAQRKEAERREKRQGALIEQLRERYPVTLPQGVVDHEAEELLKDYAGSLARQGVDLENADIDWQRLRRDVRPQAEARVHSRLLLDAVAEREGIAVSAEELERVVAEIARAQGKSVPAFRRDLDDSGRLEALRRQIGRDKTVRHLLGDSDEPARNEQLSAP